MGYLIIQLQHTLPVSETAVSIMTRLGTRQPRNWDLILGRGRRLLSSAKHLHWFWRP